MADKTEKTSVPSAHPTQTKNVLDMTFIDAAAQANYVTDTGKILPRKYTGLSAKEQRRFTKLVKQARHNLASK